MCPIIFKIPLPGGSSLPLHSYGLMVVIGFFLATLVATREARRRGLPDFVYDLGLVMLLTGFLGRRIFSHCLWAAKATIRSSSDKLSTTESVLSPIDPVDPSRRIRLERMPKASIFYCPTMGLHPSALAENFSVSKSILRPSPS